MSHTTAARRNVGQSHCRWCGKRVYSPDPCLNDSQKDALADLYRQHGSRWRTSLLALWESGNDSEELRQIRNIIGPSGIQKIATRTLRIWLKLKEAAH